LTYIMQTLKLSIVGVKPDSVSNKWGMSVLFTFCFLLLVNIPSYHSPSRPGVFFIIIIIIYLHKTPFIFYPRTLSTPSSHHKSINIRKLSDISCSVQWTSNTFFNTFLNLESSQIKIWKLCVNVMFSLAFLKSFKLSAWSWRPACFFAVNAGKDTKQNFPIVTAPGRDNLIPTNEPRSNEPLYREVLGIITHNIFLP